MTAKSLRSAQNGTLIGAMLKMMVPLIVTIPGLLGLAILSQKSGIVLLPENEAIMTGGHSYNQVLPLMMARYLGPGLLGLGVTAMIAGFMSGMAGNVSAFATVWTYDVYRPLINRKASDAHYVSMGRWCSIIGVMIGIGTAYAAMLFSNILMYLQVLVMFFIVPLFGVVIMGMLWKQATRAGGFWGLLLGTLFSFSMFFFVHWFPSGYTDFLASDLSDLPVLVSRLEKAKDPVSKYVDAKLPKEAVEVLHAYGAEEKAAEKPTSFLGKLAAEMKEDTQLTQKAKIVLTATLNKLLQDPALYNPGRFSDVSLSPELRREAASHPQGENLQRVNRLLLCAAYKAELAPPRRLEPTQINPKHAEILATSDKAKDMAVNMFSAFWSLLLTLGTVLMVSLFTTPKPDSELKNLVYGMTPLPDEGPCPWYQRPVLWALVVLVILIAVNIIFW